MRSIDPPNIIQILADDMGYGDFGCFNFGASETPQLDALVHEGVCLTQHYSASPLCASARAALLTGRYPHRTGVIDTICLSRRGCLGSRIPPAPPPAERTSPRANRRRWAGSA